MDYTTKRFVQWEFICQSLFTQSLKNISFLLRGCLWDFNCHPPGVRVDRQFRFSALCRDDLEVTFDSRLSHWLYRYFSQTDTIDLIPMS